MADRRDDVRRRAHPHQVAHPVRRQRRRGHLDHGAALGRRLADAHAADGVAVELDRRQLGRGAPAQLGVDRALGDGEQPARPRRALPFGPRPAGPAVGALERRRRHRALDRVGRALVQHHGDVDPQPPLVADHRLAA